MNKKYVILLLICIACIAFMISFMLLNIDKSIETEGFNSIKGINSIGIDEESFLEVVPYDDTSNTNPSQKDRRNMYNFKLRKRLTVEGKEVWSMFYLRKDYTDKDQKIICVLCYQDIQDGSGEKWVKFSGENVLYEFDTEILYYDYIDNGSMRDNIIFFKNHTSVNLLQPTITNSGGVVSKNYEIKVIDINVNTGSFRQDCTLIINMVVIPDNNGISIYIRGLYNTNNNGQESLKYKIVKFSLTKANILTGSKLTKNNIKDEIEGTVSPITDVTIDNERKLLLIYKEGNKFSISISNDLIINQFKLTEDYNTLESLMMGGNIIAITSYNNSVYIVGYFKNKYSETNDSGPSGDDPNRMEMIKLNISGDEIQIDSIVSLPSEFKGDDTENRSRKPLNNLFVLDNQIMLHYDSKLITMSDGSKDPNFITKPRRAKSSIDSIYKTSEKIIIVDPIKWTENAGSMNPVTFSFTLKPDDVKQKDTILVYGISIKHKDVSTTPNHLIKRFSLEGVDGEASFGFYMNDKTLKIENTYNSFYFTFVTPKQISLYDGSPKVKTNKIEMKMNIFDVGSLEPTKLGESVLKNGVTEQDLVMELENVTIYYNTFEKGEIDGNGVNAGEDRCSILEDRKKEIEAAKTKTGTKLTSDKLSGYFNTCKDEYDKVLPPGLDINNLTKDEINDKIKQLEVVHGYCKTSALTLVKVGDQAIKSREIGDIDSNDEIKATIKSLKESINTLKSKKKTQSDTSYVKGFSDSFTYVINTIKNHIGTKDTKIYDNEKLKNIKDDIVTLQQDVIENENALTCKGSDFNLKIDDLVDNIGLYKTYNDIQVKKFANLYPSTTPPPSQS